MYAAAVEARSSAKFVMRNAAAAAVASVCTPPDRSWRSIAPYGAIIRHRDAGIGGIPGRR
jgi:hypothetical protein